MSPVFSPSPWIRNPHLQNIVSSTGLRRKLLEFNASDFFRRSQTSLLNLPNDIKLTGISNIHDDDSAKPLLILFHGWEGSANSGYVVSLAKHAFSSGFNTFRLNFRDHGDTHHLNQGIFNSSRIEEVVHAVEEVRRNISHAECFLAGFSLGANFALRTAMHTEQLPSIAGVAAVCPVIDPSNSTKAVEDSLFIYHRYFTQKWKNSLRKKLNSFPEFGFGQDLDQMTTLSELNAYFIPRYTEYDSLDSYFQTYTLTPEKLNKIVAPTLVIASHDDPVIPIDDVQNVQQKTATSNIRFDIQRYGSHCAFIRNIYRASWTDQRLLNFFQTHINQ